MSFELWKGVARPAPGKLRDVEQYVIGKSLLDVGSAQGWYAKRAQEMGMDVLCTDLENYLAVEGLPFQKIEMGQIDPGSGRVFDTVLMFDVLEHMVDEDDALDQLSRVCSKRVIISVPNADDKNLPDYNVTLVNRKDTTHQRYYSPKYLEEKLKQHGFKVVQTRYDGAVLPGIVGEYIRPRGLGALITKLVNKLLFIGVLKSPYYGDVYVVADKV